jgi:hypothetical protein
MLAGSTGIWDSARTECDHVTHRFLFPMKKYLFLPAFLLVLVLPNFIRAEEAPAVLKPAVAASPYGGVESLVGGLWVATLPAGKDGVPVHIELRMTWAENKQGIRYDSAFVKGDKRAPYTSGMYAWNAAKGKLAIFYTDSHGGLAIGDITQEDNVLIHNFTVTGLDGTVETVRVRLTKASADVFTNEIFVQKDNLWTKVVEVRYDRQAGA